MPNWDKVNSAEAYAKHGCGSCANGCQGDNDRHCLEYEVVPLVVFSDGQCYHYTNEKEKNNEP